MLDDRGSGNYLSGNTICTPNIKGKCLHQMWQTNMLWPYPKFWVSGVILADHCLIVKVSSLVGRFPAIQGCPGSWLENPKDPYLLTLMCIVLYGFHFNLMKKTSVPQEMISFLSKTYLPIPKIQLKCTNYTYKQQGKYSFFSDIKPF